MTGIAGSTESSGVVAHKIIGWVMIGGKKTTLPYNGLVGNIVVQQNWRWNTP